MQERWQHTIYHQEIPPPNGAWDAIALALDAAKTAPWAQQVYQQEVTPPATVWVSVAEQLDRDSFAGAWAAQMYQQEATPPAEAWQAIARSLETTAVNDWQTAIYQQEVLPPAGSWQHIAAALDNTGAKVVSINNNRRAFLRIAAAAAVLAAVSVIVLRMARTDFSGPISQPVAGVTPTPVLPQPAIETPVQQAAAADSKAADILAARDNTARNTIAKKNTKAAVTPIAADAPIAQLEFLPADKRASLPDVPAVLTNTKKLPDERGSVSTDIARMDAPAGNYISISGPDGQSVRLSAKMASLIGYLDDGNTKPERLDIIIKESALWKTTFRAWREKMNQSLTAPSLLNLMDVIELNKLLKTGQ